MGKFEFGAPEPEPAWEPLWEEKTPPKVVKNDPPAKPKATPADYSSLTPEQNAMVLRMQSKHGEDAAYLLLQRFEAKNALEAEWALEAARVRDANAEEPPKETTMPPENTDLLLVSFSTPSGEYALRASFEGLLLGCVLLIVFVGIPLVALRKRVAP